MEVVLVDTDVLIIGGSLAGCIATIKANEYGVRVTIAEKANTLSSGWLSSPLKIKRGSLNSPGFPSNNSRSGTGGISNILINALMLRFAVSLFQRECILVQWR